MKRLRFIVRTAAGLPAAVLLSGALGAAGPPDRGATAVAATSGESAATPAGQAAAAACRIAPAVLDVSRPAGPLTVRIELRSFFGKKTTHCSTAEAIEPGVYVSSVNGLRLPAPSATDEGIGERVWEGRTVEDLADPWRRLDRPNGMSELVVRFDRPSDGNPATREDGDAGDVLAMLMGVPDGHSAPICVAGRAAGATFECCDMVEVRNRGLRDLARGLLPPSSR